MSIEEEIELIQSELQEEINLARLLQRQFYESRLRADTLQAKLGMLKWKKENNNA